MKYWLQTTNADTTCDLGPVAKDLGKAQSSGNVDLTSPGAVFAQAGSWDMNVQGDKPAGAALTCPTSLDISLLSNAEIRYRLEGVNAACSVVCSSGWSSTISTPETHTENLALVWASSAVRLRMRVDLKDSGGSGTARVRVQNSYAAIPWDPVIQQVMDAMNTRLANITKLNGFRFNLGSHGVRRVWPSSVKDSSLTYPCAFIWGATIGTREWEQITGSSPFAIGTEAEIEVRIFQKGTAPEVDIPRLAQDVVEAIEADPSKLGLTDACLDILLTGMEEVSTDEELHQIYGAGARLVFTAKFVTPKAAI